MVRPLSDILRRFRPAVAPGPAGPAGVPVDRVAEAEAELARVFVALEPAVAEAEQVRQSARLAADARRRDAIEAAEQIVAAARGRLDILRAEAASAQITALAGARAALDAEARAEVDRVRGLAAARSGEIVAHALAGVWATAGMREPVPTARDQVVR